jgi:cobalamin synthase
LIPRVRSALAFLTVLPAGDAAAAGAGAAWFPLIGALLGYSGALAFECSREYFPSYLSALIVIILWILVTRGKHEQAVAAAIPGGIAAAVLLTAVRLIAVATITINPLHAFTIAHGISRAAMVALAWIARPADQESPLQFSAALTTTSAVVALVQGYALVLWCGGITGVQIFAVVVFILWGAKRLVERYRGGFSTADLFATSSIVECALLALFACLRR